MSDIDEDDYEVGYGKPPVHSRFQQGKSGNPRGRPPGRKNIARLILEIGSEEITVTENGRTVRMSKGEATLRQLYNQGMKGDLRALREVIRLHGYAEQAESREPEHEGMEEKDRAVLARLTQRMQGLTQATKE